MQSNGPASPGHSAARILKPGETQRGPHTPLPTWYVDWLKDKGKWVELSCGCIEDIHLPSAVAILTKKPQIYCNSCNEFHTVKRPVKFREVIEKKLGIKIKEQPSEPLY
jgi:hypothetical protein